MYRPLTVALALGGLLATSPRAVSAACPDPLKPHCVYLPAFRVEKPGGCQALTGDAFDDATAWKLDSPSPGKGVVRLAEDAAFAGQFGVLLDPDDSTSNNGVGVVSVAAARRIGGIWLTFMIRRAPGTAGIDFWDRAGTMMVPDGGIQTNRWSGNWSIGADSASGNWERIVLDMDDSADGARADRVKVRFWADGDTPWHVDDAILWQCPPGASPPE